MPRKKRTKKTKVKAAGGGGGGGGGSRSGNSADAVSSTTTSQLEEPLLPPTQSDEEDVSSEAAALRRAFDEALENVESGTAGGKDSPAKRSGPRKIDSSENFIGDVNIVQQGNQESLPLATNVEPLEATLVSDAAEFNTSFQAPSDINSIVDDIVQITAPATLPEGFTFVATLQDGRAFTVTTPEGGVISGDVMEVPFPTSFLATTVVPPKGQWKDGILDCCALGCCHPTLWISWLCPLIGIGQINTRLRLNWLGSRAPLRQVKYTFAILVTVTILHFIVTNILNYLGHNVDTLYYRIGSSFSLCIILFQVYSIARTRRQTRTKYEIPESGCARGCCCGLCQSCDDICAAALCSCCATSQMLRHTADYETYRSVWCSTNGLPANAPVVV